MFVVVRIAKERGSLVLFGREIGQMSLGVDKLLSPRGKVRQRRRRREEVKRREKEKSKKGAKERK